MILISVFGVTLRRGGFVFKVVIIFFIVFLSEDLKLSFPAIGTELGGRDHTTAMHAHQKIRKEVEDDLKLKNEVELIRQRLYNTSG